MIFDHKVRYNGKDYEAGVNVPIEEVAPASSIVEEEPKKTAPRKRKAKVSEE